MPENLFGVLTRERTKNSPDSCLLLLFISHKVIRYESSRGHKIDGTKPNQTENTFRGKQGKQTEENEQESSQQITSSPCRDTEETKRK